MRAQHARDAAEVVVAEVAHRIIGMLTGDLLQRAERLLHIETTRQLMVEDGVGQRAQPRRDDFGVPADHRFRMAALYQLLHLFRLMQADGDMLLQVERHLKRARQPLVAVVAAGREHMHLLIAGVDQIDRFLLTRQQRRQRLFRVGKLGQQSIFRVAVVRQFAVDQAQGFAHRLLFPQPEPEPVEEPVPERAADIEQRRHIYRHAADQAQGKDRRHQRAGEQAAV